MQNITVDLIPGKVPELIRVSQYDKNIRTFEVKVTYGNQPYTIPDCSTIAVSGTKPDGYSFDYECQYAENTVTVTVTEQMTVCAGKVPCEIIIYDAEANRIGTGNFTLLVEESAMDEDTVVSGRDVPIFTEAVAEAIKNRNEAEASEEAAAKSEAAAKASEKAAFKSEKATLASEKAAKAIETASAESEKNAKASEQNAKTSEENSAASAKLSESWAVGGTATREGEDQNNSKYYAEVATEQARTATEKQEAATLSAKVAKDSEDAALDSQQAASSSEQAAAASEKNAKSSEDLTAQSEKNAKASETSALESKESASTSEQNAAASAKLAESWTRGGTASRDGEEENNAMYYAGLASASAEAAAKSRDSIGAAEDNCSKSAEAAKASEEAAAQSAARFDDTSISSNVKKTDYISAIRPDIGRFRATVDDIFELFRDTVYPVGSIFLSMNGVNPNSAIGGSWEQIKGDYVLQMSSGNHAANTTIEAGLPNITGQLLGLSRCDNTNNHEEKVGAMNWRQYNYMGANIVNSSLQSGRDINFNAAQSNPIYGKSNTVQPAAFVINVWKRVA